MAEWRERLVERALLFLDAFVPETLTGVAKVNARICSSFTAVQTQI
jgi:hypothetical protein